MEHHSLSTQAKHSIGYIHCGPSFSREVQSIDVCQPELVISGVVGNGHPERSFPLHPGAPPSLLSWAVCPWQDPGGTNEMVGKDCGMLRRMCSHGHLGWRLQKKAWRASFSCIVALKVGTPPLGVEVEACEIRAQAVFPSPALRPACP